MDIFITPEQAIEQTRAGKPFIIVDDPGRENQGDVFFPAAAATADKVNFMLRYCRGLICAPLTREYALKFDLALMVEPGLNTEQHHCNFTVSVDTKMVTAAGISAADRAKTLQTLVSQTATVADLVRPGHIFPLLAAEGGVLERSGHTEAATDLARLAGVPPVGTICEVLNDAGEPAKAPELEKFARKHDLGIITIADLIAYRRAHSETEPVSGPTVTRAAASSLPTTYGPFQIIVYKSIIDNREHVALLLDRDRPSKVPFLARLHSQCFTGDTLSSLRCDCNGQLHESLRLIQKAGSGLLIYLNQEGRGIGLTNKIKAYALQEQGYDTVEANHMLGLPTDARDYRAAADIIRDLGIDRIDLLTNSPDKEKALAELGITIRRSIGLQVPANDINAGYLATKKHKLGHRLNV